MRQFLVHFGANTLVVHVKDEETDVVEGIPSTFNIPSRTSIVIKRFCPEWTNWLNVLDYANIADRTELKVEIVSACPAEVQIKDNVGAKVHTASPIASVSSPSHHMSLILPLTPETSWTSSPNTAETPKTSRLLLRPFNLGEEKLALAPSVVNKLRNNEDLQQGDRSQ